MACWVLLTIAVAREAEDHTWYRTTICSLVPTWLKRWVKNSLSLSSRCETSRGRAPKVGGPVHQLEESSRPAWTSPSWTLPATRLASVGPPAVDARAQAASVRAMITTAGKSRPALIKRQHRHERLLRDLDRPDPLHPFLAFLLLFQELSLAGHIAAVALREHVLAHRRDGFASDHLTADGRLEWHLVHLARDDRLELLDQPAALRLGLAPMRDQGESVHRLGRDEHVELDQVALAKTDHLVVHRGVPLGARLHLIVEVMDDLPQRDLV